MAIYADVPGGLGEGAFAARKWQWRESIWAAFADGLFGEWARSLQISAKIDRLMPIIVETEQIADRRNSRLNSRARIFDGLGVSRIKNSAGYLAHYNG